MFSSEEIDVITKAKKIIASKFIRCDVLVNPTVTKDFLVTNISHIEKEVFVCIWLDSQHRVISYETLFEGTIDAASVYTRELVKASLAVNAAACIVAHNHPSGVSEPSRADRAITERISAAFSLVNVSLLDHMVVGGAEIVSFAERGWL
ncbi:RadC family protein [Shewanella algae]|jgi:DNA repair protein RadC|uniref:RadC family protein n=1 Tax=Shewanella algae TaxID=38313 RepID=UPI0011825434|nr:DNA repair protein RadC [Shewanella algae]MBO2558928.1 DNA repair protein RadC [Shewanella algae]MBO2575919.1 DNA repair protein RadC [Shewanella algae]TVO83410.1 hypothetical protein AYI80_19535 [Shewanella algae]TXS82003.1 hypothetical protein AYI81_21125 [Shewanella algae]